MATIAAVPAAVADVAVVVETEREFCRLLQRMLADPAVSAVAMSGNCGADWRGWLPYQVEAGEAAGELIVGLRHDYSSYLQCWAELDLSGRHLHLQRRDDKTGAGDAELLLILPEHWWLQLINAWPHPAR